MESGSPDRLVQTVNVRLLPSKLNSCGCRPTTELPWTCRSQEKCRTQQIDWRIGGGGDGGEDKQPLTTSGLRLGRSKMLRSLRHYLRAQSQEHLTTDGPDERGVERESTRRSSLKGRERAIVSQTNIGAVSKATLGKQLRAGVERNNYGVFRAHRYHLELFELNRTGRAGAGKTNKRRAS